MAETKVLQQNKISTLAGDPFASGLGLLELAKSKKGTALASVYGAIVPLILSDKLPATYGAILLCSIAAFYMLMQGLVDREKEKNRALTIETTTTSQVVAPAVSPVPPESSLLEPLRDVPGRTA